MTPVLMSSSTCAAGTWRLAVPVGHKNLRYWSSDYKYRWGAGGDHLQGTDDLLVLIY